MEEAYHEDVEDENSDEEKNQGEEKEKEKDDQKANEEDQEPIRTATNDEAEVGSKREQGEVISEGKTSKKEEGEKLDDR